MLLYYTLKTKRGKKLELDAISTYAFSKKLGMIKDHQAIVTQKTEYGYVHPKNSKSQGPTNGIGMQQMIQSGLPQHPCWRSPSRTWYLLTFCIDLALERCPSILKPDPSDLD